MLNIQGATLGIDTVGVQGLMDKINADVIVESQNSIRTGLAKLNQAVDEAWVGKSADTFKKNMESDAEEIIKNLDETYEGIKSEFSQIVNKMKEADEELIKER